MFEHQVRDIDASEKFQKFSSYRWPEKIFQHQRVHRWAVAVIGSIKTSQKQKYCSKQSRKSKDSQPQE